MKIEFKGKKMSIEKLKYGNGRTALELVYRGEPYAVATVNLPDENIADDEVVIKDYSENVGILQALVEHRVISAPTHYADDNGMFPICRLLI